MIWDRWYAVWNKARLFTAQNFYWVYPRNKDDTLIILGFLNSTLAEFFVEIEGKTLYGEGVLQLVGHNFLRIPILDPKKMTDKQKKRIEDIFIKLCTAKRENSEKLIGSIQSELDDTIFEIIGIKGVKEQVHKELENLRELRKTKKEAKIMLKTDTK